MYPLLDTTTKLNVAIFWDIAPYSPYVNRHFGEMYEPEDGSDIFL
jgi:hypothetical protein